MIDGYFGGGSEPPLWAEIQVAGWAIDGGIPLVLVSVAALVVALLAERRLALSDPGRESARVRRGRPGRQPRDGGADLQLHAVRDADRRCSSGFSPAPCTAIATPRRAAR